MEPTLISDLLTDLLAVSVASLTDPPERQYVAHGRFAFDCELVAVHLVRLTLDRPASGGGCVVLPTAVLAVTVVRCYPKAGDDDTPIPEASAINDAALVLAVDAATLAGGVADAWAAGALFPTAGIGCARVDINPGVEPLGPDGGLAGNRVSMTVRL